LISTKRGWATFWEFFRKHVWSPWGKLEMWLKTVHIPFNRQHLQKIFLCKKFVPLERLHTNWHLKTFFFKLAN
jgi:hypothetical protein